MVSLYGFQAACMSGISKPPCLASKWFPCCVCQRLLCVAFECISVFAQVALYVVSWRAFNCVIAAYDCVCIAPPQRLSGFNVCFPMDLTSVFLIWCGFQVLCRRIHLLTPACNTKKHNSPLQPAAILRDFLSFWSWQHQKLSNSARLPSKMESWVQSWWPRTNAFCGFSTPPV